MEALTDSKGTLHAKTNVRASGRTTFFDYSFKSMSATWTLPAGVCGVGGVQSCYTVNFAKQHNCRDFEFKICPSIFKNTFRLCLLFSAGVNMTDWHNTTGPISIPLGERGRVTL